METKEKRTFRRIRKDKGMKLNFVAGYLNILPQSLSQRELGQVEFTGVETQLLCILYDVPITDVDLV